MLLDVFHLMTCISRHDSSLCIHPCIGIHVLSSRVASLPRALCTCLEGCVHALEFAYLRWALWYFLWALWQRLHIILSHMCGPSSLFMRACNVHKYTLHNNILNKSKGRNPLATWSIIEYLYCHKSFCKLKIISDIYIYIYISYMDFLLLSYLDWMFYG